MRSAGIRFFVVGLLALLMFIPLFFVGSVIDSRSHYSRETMRTLSQDWGGAQAISGLVMVLPVTETVTRKKRVPLLDPITGTPIRNELGIELTQEVEEQGTEARAPVYLAPERVAVTITSTSEIRNRGIFNVPVYKADTVLGFDFDTEAAARVLGPQETAQWDKAELRLTLASNRALRRATELTADGAAIELEPLAEVGAFHGGIRADLGDPRKIKGYRMVLGFNGAQSLSIAPMGRDSQIEMVSDWPHPSFGGAFLPDDKTLTDTGFRATWSIPHLAGAVPQVSREAYDGENLLSVEFFQPNDFYQKAYRAGRYGILFIALTFLTVLLVERSSKRPAHPVQYILIGIAQSMFVLLMVAFAEQIGFAAAYLLASVATVGLITAYGATGLKLGKGAWVLGGMLSVLYAVLFLILRSADYALLAGTCLAFAALAGTMYATRNEDWYATGDLPRSTWFKRTPPAPAPQT